MPGSGFGVPGKPAGPDLASRCRPRIPFPNPNPTSGTRHPTPGTRYPVPGTPYRSACNLTCSCSRYVRDSLSFVPSRSSTT